MARPFAIVAFFLAALIAPTFADQFDETEAKKRNVSVEVVQLERAKERIAELEKQVADLKRQLAAPKAIATAPSTATHPNISPEIASTIREHRLVKGMTLEQMKSAIEGIWRIDSDSGEVQQWVCKWREGATETQSGREVEVASASISNGIIVSCETKTSVMEMETNFGNGPYAKKSSTTRKK